MTLKVNGIAATGPQSGQLIPHGEDRTGYLGLSYIAGGWWGSILSGLSEDFMGVDFAEPGLTESRSSLEGLKKGTRLAGTSTLAPVFGLRPVRALRCRVRKLPNPRISILSPALRAPMTDSNRVSTMTSPSRRVRSPRAVTLSTRSALVMSESFPFPGRAATNRRSGKDPNYWC